MKPKEVLALRRLPDDDDGDGELVANPPTPCQIGIWLHLYMKRTGPNRPRRVHGLFALYLVGSNK
jgi:hypothetical protein